MEFKPELSLLLLIKLISFLFWSWLYIWCAFDSKRSPEWCSRAVTLLHGSVASCVGLAQCNIKGITHCSLTMKVTWSQYALMVWSWGYFMFDFLWCLLYWTRSYVMLCHHLCALIAINVYLSTDYTGSTYACTIALLEITNPLLQTRWFLRDEGYNNTLFFHIVEITYLISFLMLRGILGTYLMFKIFASDTFGTYEKLISFSLYLVSTVFLYEIIGYVTYKYSGKIIAFQGIGGNEVEVLQEQQ